MPLLPSQAARGRPLRGLRYRLHEISELDDRRETRAGRSPARTYAKTQHDRETSALHPTHWRPAPAERFFQSPARELTPLRCSRPRQLTPPHTAPCQIQPRKLPSKFSAPVADTRTHRTWNSAPPATTC